MDLDGHLAMLFASDASLGTGSTIEERLHGVCVLGAVSVSCHFGLIGAQDFSLMGCVQMYPQAHAVRGCTRPSKQAIGSCWVSFGYFGIMRWNCLVTLELNVSDTCLFVHPLNVGFRVPIPYQ